MLEILQDVACCRHVFQRWSNAAPRARDRSSPNFRLVKMFERLRSMYVTVQAYLRALATILSLYCVLLFSLFVWGTFATTLI